MHRINAVFFPSNARWLSPGRLTNRKYNCILQIQRIRSVATSVLSTVCIKRELIGSIHNPLCCHRAKTGKQTAKTKTKKAHKNKQQTKQQKTRQHGWWSADQFIVLAMYKKDDSFVSPRDWYGRGKTNNKNRKTTTMPYRNL